MEHAANLICQFSYKIRKKSGWSTRNLRGASHSALLVAFAIDVVGESDLGALVLIFNMALAQEKQFTRKWREARASVDAVLTERRRRIAPPRPGS